MAKTISAGERLLQLREDAQRYDSLALDVGSQIAEALIAGKPTEDLDARLAQVERDLANTMRAIARIEPAAAAEVYERRGIELTAERDFAIGESESMHATAAEALARYNAAKVELEASYAALNNAHRMTSNAVALQAQTQDALDAHLGVDVTARRRAEADATIAASFPHLIATGAG